MMMRRFTAALLLVAMAGLLAGPIWAAGRSACAMCDKHCCCGPKPAGDRCSLRRACAADEATDLASPVAAAKPALVPESVAMPAPAGSAAGSACVAPRPLRRAIAPPDRPPRVSLRAGVTEA